MYLSPRYESDTMLRIFHHYMEMLPYNISPWYESDTMLHIFHHGMEILPCNISPWYMYIIYTDYYVYTL